jgi:hypothetical protein
MHGTFSFEFVRCMRCDLMANRVKKEIKSNKKAPIRVLFAATLRLTDRYDPIAKLACGRRTRPALTRWRFCNIRSGICDMMKGGRVE